MPCSVGNASFSILSNNLHFPHARLSPQSGSRTRACRRQGAHRNPRSQQESAANGPAPVLIILRVYAESLAAIFRLLQAQPSPAFNNADAEPQRTLPPLNHHAHRLKSTLLGPYSDDLLGRTRSADPARLTLGRAFWTSLLDDPIGRPCGLALRRCCDPRYRVIFTAV